MNTLMVVFTLKAKQNINIMEKLKASGQDLKIYTAEKAYNGNREKELFQMMESGCLISKDGHLFKTLATLKS